MTIIHIRIDERLIHGQVATMWTNTLKANRIMVIDNDVVKNEMEKTVLKMAKPASVKLSILSTDGAVKNILSGKYDKEKVFIIVKKPGTLVEMVDKGLDIQSINVGNMSSKKESRAVARSISVTPQDEKDFDYLSKHGVQILSKMTPMDDEHDFMKLLK